MTEAQKSLQYWYGKECEPSGKNHTWVWISLFIAMLVGVGCVVFFNMNHLEQELVLDVMLFCFVPTVLGVFLLMQPELSRALIGMSLLVMIISCSLYLVLSVGTFVLWTLIFLMMFADSNR